MKKIISIVLVLALMLPVFSMCALAAEKTDYTIVNPYASVDWDKCETYKANLHTHTNASDGELTLTEMVQAYYDQGYDILAITDHGVINHGWMNEVQTNGIFNGFQKVYPMSEEDYIRFTTGSDRNGRGIVDITGGIECNMAVVSKTHVNGYFTTYGQGVWGTENDYETAPAEIEKAGGYSVLNHVGDWVNSENYPSRSHDEFYISYFADIFTSYKTCLGMEIINNTDRVTREDRVLWDELLQVVIPTGRNIWGFADDDSEELGDVGRSFELFPLEENNEENVKQAMINGAFFAASKYDKTDRNNEFEGNALVPIVSRITVDDVADTISVEVDSSRSCTGIQWIADGEVISTDYTLDLNDYSDKIGCYVRFKLFGEGGVTYSQAFEIQYDGRVDEEVPENPIPDNFFGNIIRKLYQNIFSALAELICEKVAIKLDLLPEA